MIYVSLFLGILVGATGIIPKNRVKFIDKLQLIGVLTLLYVLGINIGSRKDIISKLPLLGMTGFTYAFFSAIFSILIVYLFIYFSKGGKKQ